MLRVFSPCILHDKRGRGVHTDRIFLKHYAPILVNHIITHRRAVYALVGPPSRATIMIVLSED